MSRPTLYFWMNNQNAGTIPYFNVTWQSLRELGAERFRVVVDSSGASEETLNSIPSEFMIRRGPLALRAWPLGIQRLEVWTKAIQEGEPGDLIACLDCRDILFQRDPFEDMFDDTDLLLFGEGLLHKDHYPILPHWNICDQRSFQSALPHGLPQTNCDEWPTLCAGGYVGRRWAVSNLFTAMLRIGSGLSHSTDQAILNYLYNTKRIECRVRASDPRFEDWICAGLYYRWPEGPCDASPIEGGNYRLSFARFENGIVYHGVTQRPYALVHQWDRTAWAGDVLGHLRNGR